MLTDPPELDVIEVSIFGPGKGESVVAHLGNGDWIVVDSCVDQRDGSVPALAYFDRMGVEVAKQVRLVVATHAHDDHFMGIAEILSACTSARLVCSSAITTEEFFALVEADQAQPTMRNRVRNEYRRMFEVLGARPKAASGLGWVMRAAEGRPISEIHGENGVPARVVSVSPSDEAIQRSLIKLANSFPKVNDVKRIQTSNPNELAVALWIEVGEKAVLLGADLLRGPAGCGWNAVLATFSPETKASVFKVPHHGAPNAHHEDVWIKLLAESPIALVAPFRNGDVVRPDAADVARICSLTPNAYITAAPSIPKHASTARREASSLGPLARNVREPWGRVGHVRARSRLGSADWEVRYAEPARRLVSTSRTH
jgi:hypothetical protein